MPDRYRPLKDYVAREGGIRLAMHGGLRDQLVEMAVEEFPVDAPADKVEEVLAARLRLRVKEKYGSVILAILIQVAVNMIVKLVVEWWRKRHPHKVLMEGWRAQANSDLPPAGPAQAG